MPDAVPIPEIIVIGDPIGPGVSPRSLPGRSIGFTDLPFGFIREEPGEFPGRLGFLPPALPQVIEEVVVTAPRSAPPPTPVPRLPLGMASIFAVAGGFIASKFLEEISQQALEREFEELMAPDAFVPGDTPVIPMQPEVIPEVVVTARRPPLRVAPMPQFFPRFSDPDPWVLQPIIPRELPRPQVDVEVIPDVAPAAPEIPSPQRFTVPLPLPTVVPMPQTTPEIVPGAQPRIRPATPLPSPGPEISPIPGTRADPQIQPGTSLGPLTQLRTETLTFPETRPLPGTLPQQGLCPPCPKTKEEEQETPRSQCFKKLVKEGLFPSMDQSYEWAEIDCFTGREL